MAEMQTTAPLADMDPATSALCAARVCAQCTDLSGHKARKGLSGGC